MCSCQMWREAAERPSQRPASPFLLLRAQLLCGLTSRRTATSTQGLNMGDALCCLATNGVGKGILELELSRENAAFDALFM